MIHNRKSYLKQLHSWTKSYKADFNARCWGAAAYLSLRLFHRFPGIIRDVSYSTVNSLVLHIYNLITASHIPSSSHSDFIVASPRFIGLVQEIRVNYWYIWTKVLKASLVYFHLDESNISNKFHRSIQLSTENKYVFNIEKWVCLRRSYYWGIDDIEISRMVN